MIDKIIKTKQNELVVVFTDRKPFTVYESEGDALKLWVYMNSETAMTQDQVFRAVDSESEETCPGYKLEEVA